MKDFTITDKVSLYKKNTIGGAGIWNGMDTPVFAEICDDGNINMAMPTNCPPDTIAYNKNVVRQMERKSKMIARLRAKLETR